MNTKLSIYFKIHNLKQLPSKVRKYVFVYCQITKIEGVGLNPLNH